MPAQAVGGEGHRLLPADLAPGVVDRVADHRVQDALGMVGIAPGEAALDAGMAPVRLAVLVGHHAHQLIAVELGLERTAHAAIGAGGHDERVGVPSSITDFSCKRRRRAGLHAGAAADAIRRQEIVPAPPALTRLSKPRPSIVSAKVPCTSSQARTQRLQTMHFDGS
jgi:hypothetical protein